MLIEILIGLFILLIIFYIFLYFLSKNKISEYTFSDFKFLDDLPSRTICEKEEISLSFIAPAYNEEKRISTMLDESLVFLENRKKQDSNFTYELIVIDDGCKDKTEKVVLNYIREKKLEGIIRFLKLTRNFGKGFAVRQGMMRARGKHILMLDSDGASKVDDLKNLEEKLQKIEKNGLGLAIGSRYLGEKETKADRTFFRDLVSNIFHIIFKVFTGLYNIKDSQCGFKLFTRETAKILFLNANIERWATDIELLMIAKKLNIPICEVSISWHEVEGSKLTLFGMAGILRDLLLIRLFHIFGLWKISKKPNLHK